MSRPIVITEDEGLHCSRCGQGSAGHVDKVIAATRLRESGDVSTSSLDSTGRFERDLGGCPRGSAVPGNGRRHRFALEFDCELCGVRTWLVFTQHKGTTFVEWSEAAEVYPAEEERRLWGMPF